MLDPMRHVTGAIAGNLPREPFPDDPRDAEIAGLRQRLEAEKQLRTLAGIARDEAAADNARLREALEGCLHFDDAFIAHGPAGDALKQWRAAARRLLGHPT